MDLGGIDGIAHIVSLPVGDMGNETFGLSQSFADQLHNVDVAHLIVAADVVNLAHPAVMENPVDGLAVILHIQPVPDIETFSVNLQGLIV